MLGTAGALCALRDVFGGSAGLFVVPVITVFSYIIFLSAQKLRFFILQIIIMCIGLYAVIHAKSADAEKYAENIIYCITSLKSFDTYDIGFFVILAGIVWAELGSFFSVTLKRSGLYFLLITAFALLCPYMGKGAGLYSIALMLVSYIGLHMLYIPRNVKISASIVFLSLIALCFSLSLSYYTADKLHSRIYDKADDVEGVVHRLVNDLIYSRGSDYDSGRVNSGNNYQRGTDAVEIWLSDKPTEPVYLKGFEGGDYTGNAWAEANEGDFFNKLSYEMGWNRWGNYMSAMYKEIYYNANNSSNPQILRKARTITINPLLPNVKNRYYPYMGRWEHITRKENIAYVYSYYELKDMDIRKDMLDMQSLRRFNYLQDSYEQYVYEHYLTLPSGMERLKELCAEQELESVDDKTRFIQSVLSQRTYSLRPGMAPLNRDIVEHFMFESRRGYCVHFASAAVLMYRMLGVPARYVTGYRANAGLFRELEDGDDYFKATDRDAHAWAEIYQKDKGWVPVEVTPGIGSASAAGEENTAEYTSLTERSTEADEEETDGGIESTTERDSKNAIYALGAAAALTAVIIIRRRIRLSKIKGSGVTKLFGYMLDAVSIKGEKYTGIEKDIEERLTGSISVMNGDEAKRLKDIVYGEAYGGKKADEKEREFALMLCKKSVKSIYSEVNIFKRLYMKYIKCLC